MKPNALRHIAVIGSGVVAWAAAAAFSVRVPGVRVTVIEDVDAPPSMADLNAVATPSITDFHHDLRIEERHLMQHVDSVFRLGAKFDGWNSGMPPYLHCHGEHGEAIASAAFHHHWRRIGSAAGAFSAYSVACALAESNRFSHPVQDSERLMARFGYGLHLDPAAYADYLRGYALHLGAIPLAGAIAPVVDGANGRVIGLTLADGATIAADLYVDTIGDLAGRLDDRRLLWSRWLPTSHVTVAGGSAAAKPPLFETVQTIATGWKMRAPLRGRQVETIVTAGTHAAGTEHAFTQGRRKAAWTGNVVAIGDAAVILEPLEGIGLHVAYAHIDRVIASLPDRDFHAVEIADYNRQTADEADRLRDFVILHYLASDRPEEMWRDLANTAPPETLAHDLGLFRDRGHLPVHDGESFAVDSWLAVLFGQGVLPRRPDPVAEEAPFDATAAMLQDFRSGLARAVAPLQTHGDYLKHFLKGDV